MIGKLFSIFHDSTNSFEGQRPDEKVLMLLRHHPFTVAIQIAPFILAGFVPVILGIMFAASLAEQGWLDAFFFISSVWYLFLWLATFYSLTLYTLNTVIITGERIIDSDQYGLFNRKVSELHNRRIQDVSAQTSGLVGTFLRFGDVTVQTAASEKQFIFDKVPKPEEVKDFVMRITDSGHTGTADELG